MDCAAKSYEFFCRTRGVKPNKAVLLQLRIGDGEGSLSFTTESLNAGDTYLGPEGVKALLDVVALHHNIHKLSIPSCGIEGDVVSALLCGLPPGSSSLGRTLVPAGALTRSVGHQQLGVTTLDISSNALSAPSARSLWYAIGGSSNSSSASGRGGAGSLMGSATLTGTVAADRPTVAVVGTCGSGALLSSTASSRALVATSNDSTKQVFVTKALTPLSSVVRIDINKTGIDAQANPWQARITAALQKNTDSQLKGFISNPSPRPMSVTSTIYIGILATNVNRAHQVAGTLFPLLNAALESRRVKVEPVTIFVRDPREYINNSPQQNREYASTSPTAPLHLVDTDDEIEQKINLCRDVQNGGLPWLITILEDETYPLIIAKRDYDLIQNFKANAALTTRGKGIVPTQANTRTIAVREDAQNQPLRMNPNPTVDPAQFYAADGSDENEDIDEDDEDYEIEARHQQARHSSAVDQGANGFQQVPSPLLRVIIKYGLHASGRHALPPLVGRLGKTRPAVRRSPTSIAVFVKDERPRDEDDNDVGRAGDEDLYNDGNGNEMDDADQSSEYHGGKRRSESTSTAGAELNATRKTSSFFQDRRISAATTSEGGAGRASIAEANRSSSSHKLLTRRASGHVGSAANIFALQQKIQQQQQQLQQTDASGKLLINAPSSSVVTFDSFANDNYRRSDEDLRRARNYWEIMRMLQRIPGPASVETTMSSTLKPEAGDGVGMAAFTSGGTTSQAMELLTGTMVHGPTTLAAHTILSALKDMAAMDEANNRSANAFVSSLDYDDISPANPGAATHQVANTAMVLLPPLYDSLLLAPDPSGDGLLEGDGSDSNSPPSILSLAVLSYMYNAITTVYGDDVSSEVALPSAAATTVPLIKAPLTDTLPNANTQPFTEGDVLKLLSNIATAASPRSNALSQTAPVPKTPYSVLNESMWLTTLKMAGLNKEILECIATALSATGGSALPLVQNLAKSADSITIDEPNVKYICSYCSRPSAGAHSYPLLIYGGTAVGKKRSMAAAIARLVISSVARAKLRLLLSDEQETVPAQTETSKEAKFLESQGTPSSTSPVDGTSPTSYDHTDNPIIIPYYVGLAPASAVSFFYYVINTLNDLEGGHAANNETIPPFTQPEELAAYVHHRLQNSFAQREDTNNNGKLRPIFFFIANLQALETPYRHSSRGAKDALGTVYTEQPTEEEVKKAQRGLLIQHKSSGGGGQLAFANGQKMGPGASVPMASSAMLSASESLLLQWLPAALPSHIRVVISINTSSLLLSALRRRSPQPFEKLLQSCPPLSVLSRIGHIAAKDGIAHLIAGQSQDVGAVETANGQQGKPAGPESVDWENERDDEASSRVKTAAHPSAVAPPPPPRRQHPQQQAPTHQVEPLGSPSSTEYEGFEAVTLTDNHRDVFGSNPASRHGQREKKRYDPRKRNDIIGTSSSSDDEGDNQPLGNNHKLSSARHSLPPKPPLGLKPPTPPPRSQTANTTGTNVRKNLTPARAHSSDAHDRSSNALVTQMAPVPPTTPMVLNQAMPGPAHALLMKEESDNFYFPSLVVGFIQTSPIFAKNSATPSPVLNSRIDEQPDWSGSNSRTKLPRSPTTIQIDPTQFVAVVAPSAAALGDKIKMYLPDTCSGLTRGILYHEEARIRGLGFDATRTSTKKRNGSASDGPRTLLANAERFSLMDPTLPIATPILGAPTPKQQITIASLSKQPSTLANAPTSFFANEAAIMRDVLLFLTIAPLSLFDLTQLLAGKWGKLPSLTTSQKERDGAENDLISFSARSAKGTKIDSTNVTVPPELEAALGAVLLRLQKLHLINLPSKNDNMILTPSSSTNSHALDPIGAYEGEDFSSVLTALNATMGGASAPEKACPLLCSVDEDGLVHLCGKSVKEGILLFYGNQKGLGAGGGRSPADMSPGKRSSESTKKGSSIASDSMGDSIFTDNVDDLGSDSVELRQFRMDEERRRLVREGVDYSAYQIQLAIFLRRWLGEHLLSVGQVVENIIGGGNASPAIKLSPRCLSISRMMELGRVVPLLFDLHLSLGLDDNVLDWLTNPILIDVLLMLPRVLRQGTRLGGGSLSSVQCAPTILYPHIIDAYLQLIALSTDHEEAFGGSTEGLQQLNDVHELEQALGSPESLSESESVLTRARDIAAKYRSAQCVSAKEIALHSAAKHVISTVVENSKSSISSTLVELVTGPSLRAQWLFGKDIREIADAVCGPLPGSSIRSHRQVMLRRKILAEFTSLLVLEYKPMESPLATTNQIKSNKDEQQASLLSQAALLTMSPNDSIFHRRTSRFLARNHKGANMKSQFSQSAAAFYHVMKEAESATVADFLAMLSACFGLGAAEISLGLANKVLDQLLQREMSIRKSDATEHIPFPLLVPLNTAAKENASKLTVSFRSTEPSKSPTSEDKIINALSFPLPIRHCFSSSQLPFKSRSHLGRARNNQKIQITPQQQQQCYFACTTRDEVYVVDANTGSVVAYMAAPVTRAGDTFNTADPSGMPEPSTSTTNRRSKIEFVGCVFASTGIEDSASRTSTFSNASPLVAVIIAADRIIIWDFYRATLEGRDLYSVSNRNLGATQMGSANNNIFAANSDEGSGLVTPAKARKTLDYGASFIKHTVVGYTASCSRKILQQFSSPQFFGEAGQSGAGEQASHSPSSPSASPTTSPRASPKREAGVPALASLSQSPSTSQTTRLASPTHTNASPFAVIRHTETHHVAILDINNGKVLSSFLPDPRILQEERARKKALLDKQRQIYGRNNTSDGFEDTLGASDQNSGDNDVPILVREATYAKNDIVVVSMYDVIVYSASEVQMVPSPIRSTTLRSPVSPLSPSPSSDGYFRVVRGGDAPRVLRHPSLITSCTVSDDGLLLATNIGHEVFVWVTKTGALLHVCRVPSPRDEAEFVDNANTKEIGGRSHLRDQGKSSSATRTLEPCATFLSVSFHPNGNTLLATTSVGTIAVFSTFTGKLSKILFILPRAAILDRSVLPLVDDDINAKGSPSSVKQQNASSLANLVTHSTQFSSSTVGFSPDCLRVIAVAGPLVVQWDATTFEPLGAVIAHGNSNIVDVSMSVKRFSTPPTLTSEPTQPADGSKQPSSPQQQNKLEASTYLLTVSCDGEAKLWSYAQQMPTAREALHGTVPSQQGGLYLGGSINEDIVVVQHGGNHKVTTANAPTAHPANQSPLIPPLSAQVTTNSHSPFSISSSPPPQPFNPPPTMPLPEAQMFGDDDQLHQASFAAGTARHRRLSVAALAPIVTSQANDNSISSVSNQPGGNGSGNNHLNSTFGLSKSDLPSPVGQPQPPASKVFSIKSQLLQIEVTKPEGGTYQTSSESSSPTTTSALRLAELPKSSLLLALSGPVDGQAALSLLNGANGLQPRPPRRGSLPSGAPIPASNNIPESSLNVLTAWRWKVEGDAAATQGTVSSPTGNLSSQTLLAKPSATSTRSDHQQYLQRTDVSASAHKKLAPSHSPHIAAEDDLDFDVEAFKVMLKRQRALDEVTQKYLKEKAKKEIDEEKARKLKQHSGINLTSEAAAAAAETSTTDGLNDIEAEMAAELSKMTNSQVSSLSQLGIQNPSRRLTVSIPVDRLFTDNDKRRGKLWSIRGIAAFIIVKQIVNLEELEFTNTIGNGSGDIILAIAQHHLCVLSASTGELFTATALPSDADPCSDWQLFALGNGLLLAVSDPPDTHLTKMFVFAVPDTVTAPRLLSTLTGHAGKVLAAKSVIIVGNSASSLTPTSPLPASGSTKLDSQAFGDGNNSDVVLLTVGSDATVRLWSVTNFAERAMVKVQSLLPQLQRDSAEPLSLSAAAVTTKTTLQNGKEVAKKGAVAFNATVFLDGSVTTSMAISCVGALTPLQLKQQKQGTQGANALYFKTAATTTQDLASSSAAIGSADGKERGAKRSSTSSQHGSAQPSTPAKTVTPLQGPLLLLAKCGTTRLTIFDTVLQSSVHTVDIHRRVLNQNGRFSDGGQANSLPIQQQTTVFIREEQPRPLDVNNSNKIPESLSHQHLTLDTSRGISCVSFCPNADNLDGRADTLGWIVCGCTTGEVIVYEARC